MAIVPTVEEEDGRYPHRERETLVKQRTSTVNRMKSVLIQFGVRNFNPVLRKAPEKLASVRTPEGIPLPPNTVAALRRQMDRFRVIKDQIKLSSGHGCSVSNEIPLKNSTLWLSYWCGSLGLALRPPNNWCMRFCLAIYATIRRWRPMKVDPSAAKKGLSHSGNRRVRNILIQLSWRLLKFQSQSDLVL
jgi:transposase